MSKEPRISSGEFGIFIDEASALEAMVDAFAAEMKSRLEKKRLEGWGGWDNAACIDGIRESLRAHVIDGDPVDVANFAAMLWNFGEQT